MSTAKVKRPNSLRAGNNAASTNLLFDYRTAAKAARISAAALKKLEQQARQEFPGDPMLMELHVLRAIRTETDEKRRMGKP